MPCGCVQTQCAVGWDNAVPGAKRDYTRADFICERTNLWRMILCATAYRNERAF